jgi:hypothetical protein
MLERPVGCSEREWAEAVEGCEHFIREGWSARAAECGWSEQELFALPSNWHRVDETGVAWMIGRWQVVNVDAEAVTVRSPWSESRLKFYRKDTLNSGNPRTV